MAMQRRFAVAMGDVFPAGAFLTGVVEPVFDFNAAKRADGTRPQQVDADSGLLLWQVQVIDADPAAGKRERAVSVKLVAPHQPVPPSNETPFPFTPVAFEGLTALAWIDDSGPRARIAWSYRATGLSAPDGTDGKPVSRRHTGSDGSGDTSSAA